MNSPQTSEDLVDRLANEYIEQYRNGESPDLEAYVQQHPELADTIRDLFPMIAALESMKRDDNRESARTATLRPLDLKELGDFEIVREIGRGGMGIVYEARQTSLDRRVALKILPKQSLLDPVQLKRFEREARIVARLHHTNVVSLYGAGEHNGFHFLVMELVQGQSLGRLIKTLKSDSEQVSGLPESLRRYGTRRHWRELARIGRDAALGVQHAHERGVLHRDITPANLLLDERGNVMLSDFGMARMVSAHENAGTQTMGGTLCYIPPEVFSGQFDERSDVFGLGVTLYEFLTLQPAFADASPAEALKRVAESSFRPTLPSSVNASIPKDLETIILKSIADQPAQRYASASDLADDLQRFLELRPIKARRSSVFEHAWRWGRRNAVVAALSTLALLSLVALSILMTFSFIQARSAKLSVDAALARETRHRERLDATVNVATNVLNNIYEELVPGDLQSFVDSSAQNEGVANQAASPMLSDEMVTVLDNLLEFYDQLAEQGGDNVELMNSSATALTRVADIYRQLGQPTKAMAHYATAIKTLDQLETHQDENRGHLLQKARIYNEIGRLHHADNRQKEAIENHRRSLMILENQENQSPESRNQILYETARAHHFMGRKRTIDPSSVAVHHLSNHREPRTPWLFRYFTPDGFTPGGPKQPSKRRLRHLEQAIATIEQLPVDEQHQPKNQFLLACCYREFSDPLTAGISDQATRDYEKANQLLTDLVNRFEHNPHYRYELVETLRHQVGKQPTTEAEFDRMQDLFREALVHVENLTAHHPNVPQYSIAKMHLFHRQGHVLINYAAQFSGNERTSLVGQAVDSLQTALHEIETLTHRWPDRPSHQLWNVVVGGSLGKALIDQGDAAQAKSTLRNARQSLKDLEESSRGPSPIGRQIPAIERALRDLLRSIDRPSKPPRRRPRI